MFVSTENDSTMMDSGITVTSFVASQIVSLMNDAIACDRAAVQALIEKRVECNDKLTEHPTIQVGDHKNADGTTYPSVGLLGILNGIVGVDEDGWGCIAASYGDDGRLDHFEILGKRKIIKRPTGVKSCVAY